MSLHEFMGTTPKKKPKPKLFEKEPEEIREALIECYKCKNKNELSKLAKQYNLKGYSSLKKEEVRDLIYGSIREGKVKEISEYEKRGYKKVEYRCSCKYTITVNLPKSRTPKNRYCKKCGNPIKPKIL